MKTLKILCFFYIFFLLGCSSEETVDLNCVDAKLEELGMVKYTDQEVGCNTFLELYLFNNKQYFLLGNHCADLISYPTDCEGNQLCVLDNDQKCLEFYEKAKKIGVIGISVNQG